VEILSSDRVGGIVLCGGQSARMGRPKLSLPFVVSPVVVVASVGQELPPLPGETIVTRDAIEGQGPLAGLAAGLAALNGQADAAYVSSCDVPLLKNEFIRAMIDALGTHEMAIPREDEYYHSLAGVYRTTLGRRALPLLDAGNRRTQDLVHASDARLVNVAELRSVDPELESLRNINAPDDYAAALRVAGIRPD
jgi:molybdopterin-guanine dinucleotide biosynthesis protein A